MPESHIIKNRGEEPLSNEMSEVIRHKPYWFVRNGNTVLLILLIILIACCWLIRYPERIYTQISIAHTQNSYLGELSITRSEATWVKTGQNVTITIQNQGSKKLSYLNGKVMSITDGNLSGNPILVTVGLSGIEGITIGNNVVGRASLIIHNPRLIDKLLGRLKQSIQPPK